MGTRSVTRILDGNQEICRIYRQYDGYPTGMGLDLAKLCGSKITNGCCGPGTVNGMGELAAIVVCALKRDNQVGNIYLQSPDGAVCEWAEFVYVIRGKEGSRPTIECSTHTDSNGPSIFNPKTSEGLVFYGTAKQWLGKYAAEVTA